MQKSSLQYILDYNSRQKTKFYYNIYKYFLTCKFLLVLDIAKEKNKCIFSTISNWGSTTQIEILVSRDGSFEANLFPPIP